MEYSLATAALTGVDRRSLQRSARLGREVLERAKRRAVNWHSPERSKGSVGVLYRQGPYQERWSVPGPQRPLGEVRARAGGLTTQSFSAFHWAGGNLPRPKDAKYLDKEQKSPFDTFYYFIQS